MPLSSPLSSPRFVYESGVPPSRLSHSSHLVAFVVIPFVLVSIAVVLLVVLVVTGLSSFGPVPLPRGAVLSLFRYQTRGAEEAKDPVHDADVVVRPVVVVLYRLQAVGEAVPEDRDHEAEGFVPGRPSGLVRPVDTVLGITWLEDNVGGPIRRRLFGLFGLVVLGTWSCCYRGSRGGTRPRRRGPGAPQASPGTARDL